MSKGEREKVLRECQEAWPKLPEDEKDQWDMVHQSTKVGRQLQKLEPTVALQVHPPLPANRVGGLLGQLVVSMASFLGHHRGRACSHADAKASAGVKG